MTFPIVRLEWYDAESSNEWESAEDFFDREMALEPIIAVSIGLLVYESDTHVVILQNRTYNQISNYIKIPAGCIKSKEVLNENNA